MSETTASEERAAMERPRPRVDVADARVSNRVARRLQDDSSDRAEQHGWVSDGEAYCDRAGHWPVLDVGHEVVLTETELRLPRLCTVCGAQFREARALFVHE